MSTAVAKANYGLFFDDLSCARSRALLLDYDGTAAPFSTDRDRAFPYATVPELLDCIVSTCATRVALITGRAAHDLGPLLGIYPPPEIWGTHGLERLHADGRYEIGSIREEAARALVLAEERLHEQGLGRFLESKPGSIAVHWRGSRPAEIDRARTKAYRVLAPLACQANLLLNEFDGGLELHVRRPNKGDAVRTILAEMEDAAVAYLGDDYTDEDAFQVLNGRGLTVLVRPTYRISAAQVWLRPPEELEQFLTDWIRACGGDL